MSSEVETQLTPLNNMKDIYTESICFIAPLLSLHDADNICQHYRNSEELNVYNNNNNIDNHEVYNNLGLINDSNIRFHNNQFMKLPLSMMPPPPNKVNYNNNNVKSFDRRNNRKNQRGEARPNSPKGYESDESCASFSSRNTPPESNGIKYRNARNGMGGRLGDQTVMFGKFSHSSPNMFLYHHNHNGGAGGNFHKNRYYSNGARHRHHQFNKNNSDVMVRRAHGLMERFKSRAHLMRIDPNPPGLLNGNQWDSLNQAVWDVFSSKAQKEESYIKKLNVWRTVFLFIRKFLDSYGLFLVGSTMSSFGLETSDIDICLLTKPFITDPRSDSVHHLEQLKYYLLKWGVTSEAEVIHAKVPILKFKDIDTGFEVDLNCNNSVGIRNTHLLNCYARLDWRVRPLVIIVKLWAQANNINDAKNMTISSYSWALMVIHYLQCGTNPPVLPCLHAVAPDKFNSDLESQSMDVQEDLEILRDYKSFNAATLGELLVGFLQYYSYFDFSLYAISVRTGSRLPIDECRTLKAPKNDPHQWKCLCIEEPFDYSNTARSVYDPDTFKRILEVLNCSYNELAVNKTLNSILPIAATPR